LIKYFEEALAYFGTYEVCIQRGLVKGKETFWKHKSLAAAYNAGFVETGLCLTSPEMCGSNEYWDKFSCGAANALIQEIDIVGMAEGVVYLGEAALKNSYECIMDGGIVGMSINAENGDAVLYAALKCGIGIDVKPEELKSIYNSVKNYAVENWDDPYLHGQATVLVLTIVVPITKLSKLSKVRLLDKLKKGKFAGKIDELQGISKAADEGGLAKAKEVLDGKLAKGGDEIASLVKRFDNLSPDELKQLYSRITKTEINSASKITRTQKDILTELEQRGITNPYNFVHPIEDITLSSETIFMRIHSPTNQARPWLVAIEDFKGFTSTDDLIKKLALPVLDNSGNFITQKISFAKIPAGVKVRKSVVRPQDWPGQGHQPGGATQFEIIEQRATETWFKELGNLSEFK
jgi:hypothetical protein